MADKSDSQGNLPAGGGVEKDDLEAETEAQFYVVRPFDSEDTPDKLRAALEEALEVL